jgi:hypothetical protein
MGLPVFCSQSAQFEAADPIKQKVRTVKKHRFLETP